jgi:thiol-disulfide isomerase/thioredoxin
MPLGRENLLFTQILLHGILLPKIGEVEMSMIRGLITVLVLFPLSSFAIEPKTSLSPEPDWSIELANLLKRSKEREEKFYSEIAKQYQSAQSAYDLDEIVKRMRKVRKENQKADLPAQERILSLIQKSAKDPTTIRGLVYLAQIENSNVQTEAIELLRKYHLIHPETIRLTENIWHLYHKGIEPLMREQLQTKDFPEARRPRLLFAYATHLKRKSEFPSVIDGNYPLIEERYGKELLDEFRKVDAGKLEREAIERFEEVQKCGTSEELLPGFTLRDKAKAAVYELTHLSVGKPVPEIVGEDLNGTEFRLSDSKGKVLLLSFWRSGCSACIQLVPHEREIVKRFQGKPFELIGVNSDEDKKELKPMREKHKITWRSFWCGPKGMYDELPTKWNVCGWPTMYVIDHQGIIRSKTAQGEALDRLLNDLVEQAEKDLQK